MAGDWGENLVLVELVGGQSLDAIHLRHDVANRWHRLTVPRSRMGSFLVLA